MYTHAQAIATSGNRNRNRNGDGDGNSPPPAPAAEGAGVQYAVTLAFRGQQSCSPANASTSESSFALKACIKQIPGDPADKLYRMATYNGTFVNTQFFDDAGCSHTITDVSERPIAVGACVPYALPREGFVGVETTHVTGTPPHSF